MTPIIYMKETIHLYQATGNKVDVKGMDIREGENYIRLTPTQNG